MTKNRNMLRLHNQSLLHKAGLLVMRCVIKYMLSCAREMHQVKLNDGEKELMLPKKILMF